MPAEYSRKKCWIPENRVWTKKMIDEYHTIPYHVEYIKFLLNIQKKNAEYINYKLSISKYRK